MSEFAIANTNLGKSPNKDYINHKSTLLCLHTRNTYGGKGKPEKYLQSNFKST